MGTISIKNIVKEFKKGEQAVRGINLEIADQEFVVLVGPSGCGKSTTLRMLAGLENITSGEILFDHRLVNELPPRLRNIAMVFQSYALYPHLDVRENLAFGLKVGKVNPSEIKTRVNEVSSLLELDSYLDKKPSELSGGQKQRVAMGRAIVRRPDIFLFDEPLSNLDAKLRSKMRFEIKQLHQKLKKTIVYVTHDQVEAMTLADRIVVMKDGTIQQQGKPLEIFNHPINKFVANFIGSPPMNLADGRIKNNQVHLEDGKKIPVPSRYQGQVKEGQEITLGVRAENITIKQDSKDKDQSHHTSFKEVILGEEPLGVETNLFIKVGKTHFISKVNHSISVKIGSQQDFFINLDKTYLFDRKTELTIKEN